MKYKIKPIESIKILFLLTHDQVLMFTHGFENIEAVFCVLSCVQTKSKDSLVKVEFWIHTMCVLRLFNLYNLLN